MAETVISQLPSDHAGDGIPARIIQLLEERTARGTLLDIGCAGGGIAREAARLGYRVTGLGGDASAHGESPYARMIAADLERDDWHTGLEEGGYDVILLLDVLDRVPRPDAILQRLRALLSERGVVYVSLPNVAHASVRVHLLSGHFDYRPAGPLDEAHRRFFTFDSMQALFERSGYVIHSFERILAPPAAIDLPYSARYETLLRDLEHHDIDARTFQFLFAVYPSESAKQLHHLRDKLHESQREWARQKREIQNELDQARAEMATVRERSDEGARREQQLDSGLAHARTELATRESRVHSLESQLASVQAMLSYAQEALQQQIWLQESRAERARAEQDERERLHGATIARKEGDVAALEATIARKEGDVAALEATIARKEGDVAALEATIARKEGDVAHLAGEIAVKNEYIVRLEGEVAVKNGHIGHLEDEIARYRRATQRGWRGILHRVRRLIHAVGDAP